MSFQAIYDVTQALRRLLRSQLRLGGTGTANADVTLLPPGINLPSLLGVNLYLYRATESPFLRNRDWPGDRVTPPSAQPALSLLLYYLLTPLSTPPGNDDLTGDDAHKMLGMAMLTLQEYPILNDVHIPGFDADTELPDYIRNSFEKIKIMLVPATMEELSKIWSTINQPYRLSVVYEVSLVELTPTPPPPVGGGIVQTTGVSVITLDPPRLTRLTPEQGALAHVVTAGPQAGTLESNPLRIDGFGMFFPGQPPTVQVGGQAATLQIAPTSTDPSTTVLLPAALDAGPQADVCVTVNGRTSTPLVFLVSPWLSRLLPIRTALDPSSAFSDLNLVLQGNGFTATPQAVRFDGPGGTTSVTTFAIQQDSTVQVAIPTGLANGIYQVRLILSDSSASNPRTLEVLPRLTSVGASVVTDPATGANVHQLTLSGARLNGADTRLLLDGVPYLHGANASATQLQHTLARLLDAGTYQVAVNVDGHLSRTVALTI
jgi:hypothetical protein